MKPREEQRVLRQLREARRDLERLETVIMDCFARDDQPAKPDGYLRNEPRDPVHAEVEKVCSCIVGDRKSRLRGVAELANTALLTAKHVIAAQPVGVKRERAVAQCMACGADCLPAPKNGLCPGKDGCFLEWRRWARSHPGKDRNEFANWVKAGRP